MPPFWVTMTGGHVAAAVSDSHAGRMLGLALGAQETALTLANGVYPAVVFHVGATAAADAAERGDLAPQSAYDGSGGHGRQ